LGDRPSERHVGREHQPVSSPELTPRQREVLELVLLGRENKEIAADLGLAEQSVKTLVSHLLRKFEVPNRAALADAGARLEVMGGLALDRNWTSQLFAGPSLQIAIMRGPDLRYVAVNAAFARAVGSRPIIGRTMREAFPEFEGTGHFEIAVRVYETGEPYVAHEAAADWDRGGGSGRTYTDAILQPLRGDDGEINGLAFFALDVTDHIPDDRRLSA
jgi:DNA-binding CsgD family transcriptional regulator